ncbi:MAG: low molecular weight protein-tyrosine-phosphatase [Dokdonella sp.]
MMKILFVCMGNICRSPTVEAVARVEFARAGVAAHVESAGTEDYHIGHQADPRSIRVAQAHGYPLAAHRARQLRDRDFLEFDHVFAMDRVNLRAMQAFRPRDGGVIPVLFLGDAEVPDPYYGTDGDFERGVTLAREGVRTFIERLRGR